MRARRGRAGARDPGGGVVGPVVVAMSLMGLGGVVMFLTDDGVLDLVDEARHDG